MARILYLQGSEAGTFGDKTAHLERHDHHVVVCPHLPYPRRSWRWLLAYFDQVWFRDAVEAARQACDACHLDIIVGSSRGRAMALNLSTGGTAQMPVAPAWRTKNG